MPTVWRWVLPALSLLPWGCTVLNNMDGYAGSPGEDAAVADTNVADTGSLDSGSDTKADSSVTDTAVADTAVADSAVADSAVADTVVADTFVADTAVADTSVTDTFVADTFVADTAVADTSVTDTGGGADTGTCHLVINEVQSRGSASAFDEFVEIYNPCDADIAIAGWKLAYRPSSGGTSDGNLVTFAAGVKVTAKGFVIACNTASALATTAEGTFTSGIADDGSVGLRDAGGVLVDSVGLNGAALANPFVEKAPAPSATAGTSVSRVPNGADTNDNSVDFKKLTTPTPRS